MKKVLQIACIVACALIIGMPSFALVPVDQATENGVKKSGNNKTLLYKDGKEKVKSESENKNKVKKEKKEKEETEEKAQDESR